MKSSILFAASAFVLFGVAWTASDHELVDLEEEINQLQRDLGQFRLLVQRNKLNDGKRVLTGLRQKIGALETFVTDPSSKQRELKKKATSEEFDTGARWSLETTHKPKRCTRTALPGYRTKVHFVMKLLGNNRIADSSFKTGSMPRRFVLGSDEAPPSWSRALRGACVGERRTAIVPWKQGYGAEGQAGLGVPPKADLKLIFEVVDVGSKPVPGFEPAAGGEEVLEDGDEGDSEETGESKEEQVGSHGDEL